MAAKWIHAFELAIIGYCERAQIYENPYSGPGMYCPQWLCLDTPGRKSPAPEFHFLRKRRAWLCTDCGCASFDIRAPLYCHCDLLDDDFYYPVYCPGKVARTERMKERIRLR